MDPFIVQAPTERSVEAHLHACYQSFRGSFFSNRNFIVSFYLFIFSMIHSALASRRTSHISSVTILVWTPYSKPWIDFAWIRTTRLWRHFTYLHLQLLDWPATLFEEADRALWSSTGITSFSSTRYIQSWSSTITTSITQSKRYEGVGW